MITRLVVCLNGKKLAVEQLMKPNSKMEAIIQVDDLGPGATLEVQHFPVWNEPHRSPMRTSQNPGKPQKRGRCPSHQSPYRTGGRIEGDNTQKTQGGVIRPPPGRMSTMIKDMVTSLIRANIHHMGENLLS